MAVTECKLISGGELTLEKRFRRTYELDYRIETDADDTHSALLVYLGATTSAPHKLPLIGAAFAWPDSTASSADVAAYCNRVTLRHLGPDHPDKWDAHATFGPLEPNEDQNDNTVENPLNRPTKYRLETYEEMRDIEKGKLSGSATEGLLTNAAGEAFTSPVQQEEHIMVLVAERNYSSLAQLVTLNQQFSGKVNSVDFLGMAPRTGRCLPIQCSEVQTENGISYYTGTIRIAYNPETWDRFLVNRGFNYLSGGVLKPALDTNNQKVADPILLTPTGDKLPQGQVGNYRRFETRMAVDFAGLDI